MLKLIIFAIILAAVFGVLSYQDEKLVIDTVKGKEIVDKSSAFVKKNVDKGSEFIQENVEVK
mgnify:CR=1 FL=1